MWASFQLDMPGQGVLASKHSGATWAPAGAEVLGGDIRTAGNDRVDRKPVVLQPFPTAASFSTLWAHKKPRGIDLPCLLRQVALSFA
eukprot:9198635-Pyramimonas_sp.AAC.1